MSNDSYEGALRKLLREQYASSKHGHGIRVVTKRGRHSTKFAEVSARNTEIIDELVKIAEKLAGDGKGAEASKLISIIKQLLDNNYKLQQTVGDALQDIHN